MVKCAVKGCLKKCKNNVIYYPLPIDSMRRKQWLDACFIKYSKPSMKICSLHFRSNDFVARYATDGKSLIFKKVLKENAIPNVDNSVESNKRCSRTQKREIRSYVLATQRRLAVKTYLDKYSLSSVNKLCRLSYTCNLVLLQKMHEKQNEISELKKLVNKLKKKNLKLKMKYQYLKKFPLNRKLFTNPD